MSDDTKWSLTPTPPPHLLSLFPTFKVTRGKNRSLKVTVSNYVHILRVSIVFLGFERRFFPSKNLFPYQLTSGSASCERSHALRTSNYVVLLNFLRLFPPLSLPCPPLHYPSPPPVPPASFYFIFSQLFLTWSAFSRSNVAIKHFSVLFPFIWCQNPNEGFANLQHFYAFSLSTGSISFKQCFWSFFLSFGAFY